MIPFIPQPLQELRSRFSAALDDVYDPESVNLGVQSLPGNTPKQVFSFATGVRLVFYRFRGCTCAECLRCRNGKTSLVVVGTVHVLADLNAEVVRYVTASSSDDALRRLRRLLRAHVRLLLPSRARLTLRDVSDPMPTWEVRFDKEEEARPGVQSHSG